MLSDIMRRNQEDFVKDKIPPAECSSPGNSVQIPVFHRRLLPRMQQKSHLQVAVVMHGGAELAQQDGEHLAVACRYVHKQSRGQERASERDTIGAK